MISAHCPRHGHTVLLPTSRISGVESTERSHLVRWTCTCGTRGTTSVSRRRPTLD